MSCLVFPKATVRAAGRWGSSLHYVQLSCSFCVQLKRSSKKSCWCRKNKINVEKTRTHQSAEIFTGSTCAFPSSLKPDPAEECLCVRGRPRGKRRPSTKKPGWGGVRSAASGRHTKTTELPPTQSEGDTSRHGNLHLHSTGKNVSCSWRRVWNESPFYFCGLHQLESTVRLRNRGPCSVLMPDEEHFPAKVPTVEADRESWSA